MDDELNLTELKSLISQTFSMDELRALTLTLNVRWEFISGENLSSKIDELIGFMYRRGRLTNLIQAVSSERPNVNWPNIVPDVIEIPFVIVSMNRDEAESLWELPASVPQFHSLYQSFDDSALHHLSNCYKETRETWLPFGNSQGTIQEIIEFVIEYLNQDELNFNKLPLLKAEFYSSTFFSLESHERIHTWRNLHRTGCVFVVDPISLSHPKIAQSLLQSQLMAKNDVAMLVVSPIDPDSLPTNELIEAQIYQQIAIPYARFDQEFDRLCEFGIGNIRSLKRRLYAALPETASLLNKQKPNRASRFRLRQQMGNPGKIDQLIFQNR